MKVAELLESRKKNWTELEVLCSQINRKKLDPSVVIRFASLYRSACADLALADSYQLPRPTIRYLHNLVGRAHNQLYRSRRFDIRRWGETLFVEVPQMLFKDWAIRLSFVIFFGFFFLCMLLAAININFAHQVAGKAMIEQLDSSFSQPIGTGGFSADSSLGGTSFYIIHNTSIGLRVFAMGLVGGVLGLFETVANACMLGAAFGYMSGTEYRDHFFEFVTAHAPFELTAIVVSAAAGMRMGFAWIDTKGYSRLESVKRASRKAIPIMGLAMVLFFMAACIEAFISPSPMWWSFKICVASLCSLALIAYFFILGYPRNLPERRLTLPASSR
ncbi:Stage II sporulation protein M [Planctomycetales bacterium 10988]|nr:Stage II sporulation protein M [Planctomycetales bacterium 10988]